MPLLQSKSKAARQQNIRTEIHAGKPIKQAVAIGYAIQRRAKRDKLAAHLAGKGHRAR
jgi:hypothetical protein